MYFCVADVGVVAEHCLQLTLINTPEGLTLKSSTTTQKHGSSNTTKSETTISSSWLINEKINLLNVSVLNLSHCDLKCVPKELSLLENLLVFNLSHNHLYKPPECLEINLRCIEVLDLSYNNLREFEAEPACHIRLKVLLLNDNNLLNIPEWILYVRCINLEEFDYSFNEINSLYASQFNVFSNYKLKKLGLQSCYVLERDFKYINDIQTLEYLDLSNQSQRKCTNTIKGDKLFEKPLFSETLQILKLNYLTLSILSENIDSFVNLRELYLKCNNLSWLPEGLTCLKNLEVLDVSENNISYLPQKFNTLCNLRKLIAYTNSISHLRDLSEMPQLRYLDLYRNNLTEFPFTTQTFTHLDLEQNYFATSESLVDYQDYLKKRQSLRTTANFTSRTNESLCPSNLEQSDSLSVSSYSTDDNDERNFGEELKRVESHDDVEELWDAPCIAGYVRVCTASDDEWLGSEPPLVALRKKRSQDMHRPRGPSPHFSDAE